MSKRCPMCKGKGFLVKEDTTANLYRQAYKLRKKGYSFREVSKSMGLSHASQSKHYYDQWVKIKPRKWWQVFNN